MTPESQVLQYLVQRLKDSRDSDEKVITSEGRLLQRIVQRLKCFRDSGETIWWLKIHGGPLQRAGVPDLLIIYHGRAFFFELKSKGQHATKLQQATLDALAQAGAVTAVVYDARDVIELLTTPDL